MTLLPLHKWAWPWEIRCAGLTAPAPTALAALTGAAADPWGWVSHGLPADPDRANGLVGLKWLNQGVGVKPGFAPLPPTNESGWKWENGALQAPPGEPAEWSSANRTEGALLVLMHRGANPWHWGKDVGYPAFLLAVARGFTVLARAMLAHPERPRLEDLQVRIAPAIGEGGRKGMSLPVPWLEGAAVSGREDVLELLLEEGFQSRMSRDAPTWQRTPRALERAPNAAIVRRLLACPGLDPSSVWLAVCEWEKASWRADDASDVRAAHRARMHAVVGEWWEQNGPPSVRWDDQVMLAHWVSTLEGLPPDPIAALESFGTSALAHVMLPAVTDAQGAAFSVSSRPWMGPWRDLLPWLWARKGEASPWLPAAWKALAQQTTWTPTAWALRRPLVPAIWGEAAWATLRTWAEREVRLDRDNRWSGYREAIQRVWLALPPLQSLGPGDFRGMRTLMELSQIAGDVPAWPMELLERLGQGEEWLQTPPATRAELAHALLETLIWYARTQEQQEPEKSRVVGFLDQTASAQSTEMNQTHARTLDRLLAVRMDPALGWPWQRPLLSGSDEGMLAQWAWALPAARSWTKQCRQAALDARLPVSVAPGARRSRL